MLHVQGLGGLERVSLELEALEAKIVELGVLGQEAGQ